MSAQDGECCGDQSFPGDLRYFFQVDNYQGSTSESINFVYLYPSVNSLSLASSRVFEHEFSENFICEFDMPLNSMVDVQPGGYKSSREMCID